LLIRFPVDLDADVTPAFARPSRGLKAFHSLVLLDVGLQVVADDQRGLRSAAECVQGGGEELR
jgi:hypothetical protein